ncbi:NUDIX hydrolase [Gordonibacter urolithinfaciens]|nr:NUDIX hydrolase [Gordonibacter urolithinfaciens]
MPSSVAPPASHAYNVPMALIDDIRAYEPFNEQEAVDRLAILRALADDPHVFDRSAPAHMACSIWTVDPDKQRTLMVYHNLYDSWSWIGGHADGERDLARVALRELEEETGVAGARLVPCGPGGIFSLEVLTVDGHEKRGRYVGSHLHLNVTYLAVASPEEPLRVKPDENSGVRWVDLDDVCTVSTEPWIADRIYRKLIEKLAGIAL